MLHSITGQEGFVISFLCCSFWLHLVKKNNCACFYLHFLLVTCRTAGEKELKLFLLNPDTYVNSGVQLPTDLPCRRSQIEVKEMFPRQFEIQGFCPVTYIEGNKRYSSSSIFLSFPFLSPHPPSATPSSMSISVVYFYLSCVRYKSLVPGDSQWSVEYKGKLFCCASKEKLEKFMR